METTEILYKITSSVSGCRDLLNGHRLVRQLLDMLDVDKCLDTWVIPRVFRVLLTYWRS